MDDIHPNEVINGRYVLKESKGRGTFGQVWLAYDKVRDKDVAIKFYVALDHKGREEFIQEFRIADELRHPNLLVTMDYGEWQDHPYLTMKYCGNGSAGDLVGNLQPGRKDERTIWRFIHDVAAGLAYLHAVKPDPIVHQDIKPDNVLIDSDGTFLISDFGISKRIRNTMRKQSTTNLKAGAPAYMGPERFSKDPEPILASDMWSLGASIYELAEGELPFSGMGGIMMNQGAEMPNLSQGWSKNLNDIMHWCLEKNTWDRAKASQVEGIAKKVLDSDNSVNVQSLIAETQGKTKQAEPKSKKKRDTRATNPYANEVNEENNGGYVNTSEKGENGEPVYYGPGKKPWYKRPISLIIASLIVLAAVVAIWYVSSHSSQQPATSHSDDVVTDTITEQEHSTKDTTIIGTNQVDEPKKGVKTNNKVTPSTPLKPSNPPKLVVKEEKTTSGTLDLGYATWSGGIKGGKPDGKGIMTFSSSHRIDSRDPNGRVAEAGDRVVGIYVKGHLDFGTWHKSDGTTETIMLGE